MARDLNLGPSSLLPIPNDLTNYAIDYLWILEFLFWMNFERILFFDNFMYLIDIS